MIDIRFIVLKVKQILDIRLRIHLRNTYLRTCYFNFPLNEFIHIYLKNNTFIFSHLLIVIIIFLFQAYFKAKITFIIEVVKLT